MTFKVNRILDSEAVCFVASVVLVLSSLPETNWKKYINIFLISSLIIYWGIKYLKIKGCMRKMWKRHVVDKAVNRFSFALPIIFLDRLHILLAFSNIFLWFTNRLFYAEQGKSINSWSSALKITLTSVGFPLVPNLVLTTRLGYFWAFLSFLVGYVILGILVAICVKALEVIFKDY